MRFFRRKKEKKGQPFLDIPALGDVRIDDDTYDSRLMLHYDSVSSYGSVKLLNSMPSSLLMRIFSFVCPQTGDESYEPCEQSTLEDSCPLCDLRDLAHCVIVSLLAEKRKRKSFFERNGDPEDTASARLKLLARTLREDPVRLGKLVHYFKIPYMLRESSQNDLSRTLAVLPNIKYVDLPEGLFSDDPNFATLRLEVEARCPDLRKMTYMAGSEQSLSKLAYGSIWPNLEVLELTRISLDPLLTRHVLSALPKLRALKVTECKNFTDQVFANSEELSPMPQLQQLVLHKVPISVQGVADLMSQPGMRASLTVLNLWRTEIKPDHLQGVLSVIPNLKTLAIHESVSRAIVSGANLPKLTSQSLETIRYEISNSAEAGSISNASTSYYTYLASSILSGGLPNLHAVYVRDPYFPDHLMGLPPPPPQMPGLVRPRSSANLKASSPMFSPVSSLGPATPQNTNLLPPSFPCEGGRVRSGVATNRFSSNNPFAGLGPLTKTIEVFAKGDDSMDWSFIKVAPHATPTTLGIGSGNGRHRTHARSVSNYGLGTDVAGMGWDRGNSRHSIMVGHASGGNFLALPGGDEDILPMPSPRFKQDSELWPRPQSSGMTPSRGSKDLWG
ncbi:F-box domain-containing protein [Ceratocystis lukuohia]|uniref:F-box domain-containing protein n=1 Tax=Ceratocystis lukuohia TaxID=2019550 RepID=A0ABR4MM16_9PEZI